MLASAAISALVLPLPVGDRIATDGGWVRNFPLGAALDHPDVNLVVAFRYVPQLPAHWIRRARPRPAQVEPLPRRPAGPRLHRRARRGGGARAPRRAGPPRRHARPSDASRDPAQHGARGAARRRARRSDPGARRAARRRHPYRDRACAAGPPRPGGTCCRGALRADCAAKTRPADHGARLGWRRESRRGVPQPPRVVGGLEARPDRAWLRGSRRRACGARHRRHGAGRLALRLGGLAPELDVDGHRLRAAIDLELHGLARLVVGQHVAKLLQRCDALAADRDDQIASERVALTGDDGRVRPRLQAGLGGGRSIADGLDEHAGVHGKPEDPGQLLGDGAAADAEKRAVDLARRDELGDDRLDRVRRHCEADADIAVGALRGRDLRVDPDHLRAFVQQRTA